MFCCMVIAVDDVFSSDAYNWRTKLKIIEKNPRPENCVLVHHIIYIVFMNLKSISSEIS